MSRARPPSEEPLDPAEARLLRAAAELAEVQPERGLAQRIALRVRDEVAHEERVAQGQRVAHEADRARRGWSVKTRVRLLLASVALHVLVLGWLVFARSEEGAPRREEPVGVAVLPPNERVPAHELTPSRAPEDFGPALAGPIVPADAIPDSMLLDVGLADDPAPLQVRVAEHPWPVQLEMVGRTRPGVRSGRLARTGASAPSATAAVARGLEALARLQRPDGSFPLDGAVDPAQRPDLSSVGLTALGALPFLAEGRGSCGEDPVVGRALAWLRGALAATASPGNAASDDLALALIALSEDYMLCYGRLPPAETTERGREIARLVTSLGRLQAADGSFQAPVGVSAGALAARVSPWPLLALDAVRHTGLATSSEESQRRLEAWLSRQPRTAEGLPATREGRPDAQLAALEVLAARLPLSGARMRVSADAIASSLDGAEPSVGTLAGALALYRSDVATFTRWNRAASEALARRIGPAGVAMRGDPVADTALTVLALQAAYRSY